jgi:DNA polymerase III epsilon subunit-like protein
MPVLICPTPADELDALKTFAESSRIFTAGLALPPVWAGFCNSTYDCPVMEARAILHGLPAFGMDIRKYGSKNVVDLHADLTFGGNDGTPVMSRSLKAMAKRLGIENTDGINGDEIAALVAAGQWDAVADHCRSDVATTAALYRLRHTRPAIVFDLEAVAVENAADFKEFVKPDGRLTDPKKIEASIEEKLSKAALDPWLCRIVALGWELVS